MWMLRGRLCEACADTERMDQDGWTPLHSAVGKGHEELVRFLCKALLGACLCVYQKISVAPSRRALSCGGRDA